MTVRPPLLEKQVESALRVLAQYKGAARDFVAERHLVVLWGLWRGWSARVTARKLGVHPSTIHRDRKRFNTDPSKIFWLPVLHKALRGNKPLWTCLFCGEEMRGRERPAREHVARHVVSLEALAMYGVMPDDQ